MADLAVTEVRSLPIVFVCSFAVAYFLWKSISSRRKSHTSGIPGLQRPPTFRSVPLLGSFPFIPKDFRVWHIFFHKRSSDMGKIIGFNMASKYSVMLNGMDAIQEALVKQSLHFSDRPKWFTDMTSFNKNRKGLIHHPYDAEFRRQHQLVLSILKEFGFGKAIMEKRINEQVKRLVEQLSSESGGKPLYPRNAVAASVFRVILSIIAGQCYEDELVTDVTDTIHGMFQKSVGSCMVTDRNDPKIENFVEPRKNQAHVTVDKDYIAREYNGFLPWVQRKLTDFTNDYFHLFGIYSHLIDVCTEDSFIRYYVDREGPEFDRDQLQHIIRDLLIAGSETTTTQLMWAIVLLAGTKEGREVQCKMRNEIDSVVPRDRLPSLADKPQLPYIEACILEMMRFKTITPLAVMHETSSDTCVGGYFIPAGTVVYPNLYSVHMDPQVFPEPDQFRPERFLDDNGNVIGRDLVVPFSLGRRSCLGELLARQELFLFISGLVHQFIIEPPVGCDTIECQEKMVTISVAPTPYEVRFIRRPSSASD